jgi:hypothetical protein
MKDTVGGDRETWTVFGTVSRLICLPNYVATCQLVEHLDRM